MSGCRPTSPGPSCCGDQRDAGGADRRSCDRRFTGSKPAWPCDGHCADDDHPRGAYKPSRRGRRRGGRGRRRSGLAAQRLSRNTGRLGGRRLVHRRRAGPRLGRASRGDLRSRLPDAGHGAPRPARHPRPQRPGATRADGEGGGDGWARADRRTERAPPPQHRVRRALPRCRVVRVGAASGEHLVRGDPVRTDGSRRLRGPQRGDLAGLPDAGGRDRCTPSRSGLRSACPSAVPSSRRSSRDHQPAARPAGAAPRRTGAHRHRRGRLRRLRRGARHRIRVGLRPGTPCQPRPAGRARAAAGDSADPADLRAGAADECRSARSRVHRSRALFALPRRRDAAVISGFVSGGAGRSGAAARAGRSAAPADAAAAVDVSPVTRCAGDPLDLSAEGHRRPGRTRHRRAHDGDQGSQ